MKNVLIVVPVEQRHKARLEKAGEGCRIEYRDRSQVTREILAETDILLGNIDPELLVGAERLQWVHLGSSGADAYVKPGILCPGVKLTCSTGAYSQAVAEHAFAQTLMLQKNLHLYRDNQLRHQWKAEGAVSSMADATVAIVGLGEIGLYYGRLAKAMGARVLGVKRRPGACPEGVDELVPMAELEAALARADVVMSVLPETAETVKLFDAKLFAAMKEGSLFLNVGRGSAVDEDALQQALRSGHLRAAALDVTEQEPLPDSSPLWDIPNLFITPHVAGHFFLKKTLDNVVDIAAKNLAAFLKGEQMCNFVDFSTGYRK